MALLLFVSLGLGAQEQAAVERRLLLQVTAAGFTADELFIFSRSLLMRLQDAGGRDIRVDESPTAVVTDEELAALATQRGDDAWLSVAISEENGSTKARARSYDLFNKAPGFDTTVTRTGKITPLDLPYEKWDEIASAVTATYGPHAVAAQTRVAPGSATVTVVAKPGTRITGPRGVDVRVGKEGNAAIVLETPGQYTLRAELSGYRPVSRFLFVTESRVVTIVQELAPRLALDASIFDSGIPNMELAWFFLPYTDYLRAGLDLYSLSLAFDDQGMFFSRPVTELELQVGHVVGAEDDLFRYAVGFGWFLRVNHSESFPWVDTSSPGGMSLLLGADIRVAPKQRVFIEYTPRFYALNDKDTFQSFYVRSTYNSPGWVGWVFGNTEAAELLAFRIGYRWLL